MHNGTKANTTLIEYPFKFGQRVCVDPTSDKSAILSADVSSDARFFVATCVLSILYALFISAVYAGIDEIYTSKPEVPLAVSATILLSSRWRYWIFNLFIRTLYWRQFWPFSGCPVRLHGRMARVHWKLLPMRRQFKLYVVEKCPCSQVAFHDWTFHCCLAIWISSCGHRIYGNSIWSFQFLLSYDSFYFSHFIRWNRFLYKETHWFKERQQPSGEDGVGSSTMNAPNI